jgi:hypothetical protein
LKEYATWWGSEFSSTSWSISTDAPKSFFLVSGFENFDLLESVLLFAELFDSSKGIFSQDLSGTQS